MVRVPPETPTDANTLDAAGGPATSAPTAPAPPASTPAAPTLAQPPAEVGTEAAAGDVPSRALVPELERYVRAALASTAVALLGGVVAAQYVGSAVLAYLTPFVLGVLTGAAAQAAAGGAMTGPAAGRIRVLAGVYAVLGVAFGFVLERSEGVLATAALLPYLAAVGGVVLWTQPVKPRR